MTRIFVCVALLVGSISSLGGRSSPLQQQPVTRARPNAQLPMESAGWDSVLRGVLSAFNTSDVVALGEAHGRKADSDLRIRLVRHPEFPKTVRFIVVEFANSLYQPALDQYVQGDDVPVTELQKVWQTTYQGARQQISPVYIEFLAAVRDVNTRLAAGQRLRVLAGEPPIDWTKGPSSAERQQYQDLRTATPVALLREVLKTGDKALVIYGSGHLWHGEGGITRALEVTNPGRVFALETLTPISSRTGPESKDLDTSLRSLDKTLQSGERPVLVYLRASPAGKLLANPFFLGQAMLAPGTTLGDLDDALVYFGMAPEPLRTRNLTQ